MINRREFLGTTVGAGASLALTPELLRALQQSGGKLIQQSSGELIKRAIPSSGEMLPVIGVARGGVQDNTRLKHLVNMLDPSSEAYAMLKAVVKTMVDNGGRVLDSAWGGVEGQQVTGMIANDLGIQNKIFWSTGLPGAAAGQGAPPPDAAAVKAHLEAALARLKVPTIDLIMVSANSAPTRLGVLKEAKKEGRIRYIGVDSLPVPGENPFAPLEAIMRNEPIDFVGIPHYHIAERRAEETLLPLAQERKIGVVVYMPFGLGRLFQRAGTTPVPAWAAEFDVTTWAQLFLKYIVSHPAVTVVLPGTSSAKHMLDNIGGGIGRLPNEATRKRMRELVDFLPPSQTPGQPPPGPAVVLSADILDRYVGKYRTVMGTAFAFRRDGATLFVKPGDSPEGPLVARSETRFSDPRGPVFEFQLDAQGKATGAIVQQGSQQTQLMRN